MKVVDNREARVIHAEDVRLLPGKNRIEGADLRLWETAKKNDVVKHMLKAKILVEESVDTNDEAQALELVEGLNDVPALEALELVETRPAVLAAVRKKLEKLGPTPEQKKALADAEAKNVGNRKEAAKAAAVARGKPANPTEE